MPRRNISTLGSSIWHTLITSGSLTFIKDMGNVLHHNHAPKLFYFDDGGANPSIYVHRLCIQYATGLIASGHLYARILVG